MLSLLLCAALGPAPSQNPLPILIVTGQNNHDWEYTSKALEASLSADGRFDVDVTTDPAAALADEQGIARYRAFVLDYNGKRWGDAAEAGFTAAVEAGAGVVVVHAANNAFRGWEWYENLVCLSWKPGHTGHGRFHAFDVAFDDRDHPITRTLADMRAHPDELYHKLEHMNETDFRLLGDAFSDPETGGTGEREPMLLVKHMGAGRIVHTPLGHVWRDNEESRKSHEDPQFRNLILRCTEWAATGRVLDGAEYANRLTPHERTTGWRLLFDGETTDGWRRERGEGFPDKGWEVVNGCLRHAARGGGGNLVSSETFADFELELEWMVAAGANSGVKYRFDEAAGIGPEYQILDDSRHRDGVRPKNRAGALYDVQATGEKHLAPLGQFNHTRIVARGTRLEHWLNGERVLVCDTGSDQWASAVQASKFKGREGFATKRGPIFLQDHGDEVWFRSIKIRDLDALPGEPVKLFENGELDGWENTGNGLYEPVDGGIRGHSSPAGGHSFLVSEGRWGNFILDVDLELADRGNSGIQVRSDVADNGRVFGYQIEIDPSDRRWSGGLYEEGRRGWLQNLKENVAGQQAFDRDGWNHYHIECVGPSIKVRVNGVPTVDYLDGFDLVGRFGFQVHGGRNTDLTWKNITLRDLGTSSWETWVPRAVLDTWENPEYWKVFGDEPATFPSVVVSSAQDEVDDTSFRVLFRGGGWGIAARTRDFDPGRPGHPGESLAPALRASEHGFVLDSGDETVTSAFLDREWQEAILNLAGERVSLLVNGKQIFDVRSTVGPPSGGWALLRIDPEARYEIRSASRLSR